MISLVPANLNDLERQAEQAGLTLPIEQTGIWAEYQKTVDGRRPWGAYIIEQDGEAIAFISLIDFETHGYHYLRSVHGPSWVAKPSPELEHQVRQALVDEVRRKDKNIVFLRIDLWDDEGTVPVLSTVPYNETVVIDVTGGDDEIISRMKKRGRRDVRKSLRECTADCSDETELATKDFSQYYELMVETGKRDGFTPAPAQDYTDMLVALGPKHCRLFAARDGGRVTSWSIVTINGTHAVRYYASMHTDAMRSHVTDKLLYNECCILGKQGITEYDLMGIGNDFAPSLKGLNVFKTKFTEDITPVAPGRDVPIKKGFYRALTMLQSVRRSLRHKENSGK